MNSTHRFIEDKSVFGNLTASYEEMISSVDKGTAVDVMYFGFQNISGHGLPTECLQPNSEDWDSWPIK